MAGGKIRVGDLVLQKVWQRIPSPLPLPPDFLELPTHELFIGTASINSNAEALKPLFKLKKVLAFAERFEPFALEEQYKAGKLTWNLGYFLDFEVAQVKAECLRIGVPAIFCKVERIDRKQ